MKTSHRVLESWQEVACLMVLLLLIPPVRRTQAQGVPPPAARILVIDHSRSMRTNDPKKVRLDAATLVVDSSRPADRVGVVAFGRNAAVVADLTAVSQANKSALCAAIHRDPGVDAGGTDIVAALALAAKMMLATPGVKSVSEIVLLTDGLMEANEDGRKKYTDEPAAAQAAIKPLVDAGVPVHCVALGAAANTSFLKGIATSTQGGYFVVRSGEALLEVYLQIMAAGKAMVSAQSTGFAVWPGAAEVALVLFKSEPAARFGTVRVDGQAYAPDAGAHYSSRSRPAAPKFYDLSAYAPPKPGAWQVEVAGLAPGEKFTIYVLQSAPFDFEVVSPRGGKEVLDQPVRFATRFKPKPGATPAVMAEIEATAKISVRLADPNEKKSSFELTPSNGVFQTERTLTAPGPYLADFTASFQPKEGAPWETTQRRIFQLRPPDFGIVLDSPREGGPPADPFAPVRVQGTFKKLDPQCTLERPPPESRVTAELRYGGRGVFKQAWVLGAGALERDLLEGPVLEPGEWTLEVSAKHPLCSIRPAEARFPVAEWPPPPTGWMARLTAQTNGPLTVGGSLLFLVSVVDRSGQAVVLGTPAAGRWGVLAAAYELTRVDRQGPEAIATLRTAPSAKSAEVSATCPVRVSGTNRLDGKAWMGVGLFARGELRHTNLLELPVPGPSVVVPAVARFEVTPLDLAFRAPLKEGAPSASDPLTVRNVGETELQLTVILGDFVCGGAERLELPRAYATLSGSGKSGGSARQRVFSLDPGQQAQITVDVAIPTEVGEIPEGVPAGVYEAPISVQADSGQTNRVTARLERKL